MSDHLLKRYGSVDSLSAWSPSERHRSEYTLRKFLETDGKRRPPTVVDRTELNKKFRQRDTPGYGCRSAYIARRTLSKSADALRAENTRLKRKKKVIEDQIRNSKPQIRQNKYKKLLDKEYNILNKEYKMLKEESMQVLISNVDGEKFAYRVQKHLEKVLQFFNCNLSHIISKDSPWPLQQKTILLEHLKKLFIRNVSQMDKWIDLIIKPK